MSFAFRKDRKPIARSLRSVYRADNAAAGLAALEAFEEVLGLQYRAIAQSWRRHRDEVIPFFACSEAIRWILHHECYRTIDSKLRRAVRTAVTSPVTTPHRSCHTVLDHAADEWKRPPREWCEAKAYADVKQVRLCEMPLYDWQAS